MHLMFWLSLSAPVTAELSAVISVPWSMASVNRNTGIFALMGLSPAGRDCRLMEYEPSRQPLLVPGRPTWPVSSGSIMMDQQFSSPLLRRCGPQPCTTYSGLAAPISAASSLMRSAEMPQMGAAHSGVFSTMS